MKTPGNKHELANDFFARSCTIPRFDVVQIPVLYCRVCVVFFFIYTVPMKAPHIFKAHAQSSTEVTLSWTTLTADMLDGEALLAYHVFWIAKNYSSFWRAHRKFELPVFNSTSYTITDLQPFCRYLFRVAASTRHGVGILSQPAEVLTDESSKYR